MKRQKLTFALSTACVGLSAAAQPARQGEIGQEGFDVIDPGWTDLLAPGEWCGTTQRYMAQLAAEGLDPMRGLCPPAGPCDDPLLRDAFISDFTEVKTVRLSIHIFCESGGANCADTLEAADAAVARLNTDYAPWGYQFVHSVEFVNNTKYRWLASNEEAGMKRSYADSPGTMLNIYVVDTGGVSWGTFPWTAPALTVHGGIVMDDNAFGAGPVISHEVGHCLGLWHTFHGVDEVAQCGDCYEPAGRPPEIGDVTGDLCSDTNPTLRSASSCGDPLGFDACSGNPWLDTPFRNYMSYSLACGIEFTAHQAGRMHCWTEDVLTGWLVPPPPPEVPGTPVLTSQGGGQILVAWEDKSGNETGFQVERARKSGKKWVDTQIVADVGTDVTSIINLPGSGTFRYHVRAYNADGASAWSDWAEITN